MTDFQKAQAAQEFPLHCSLNHDNVVKGIEWSENDDEYILVMEYSNRADYFKEKIDVVTYQNPLIHSNSSLIEPHTHKKRTKTKVFHP